MVQQFADILIVTGQGIWFHGRFFAEFKDLVVYLDHLKTAWRIAQKYRYTHVVLSGGYTQAQVPHVSEAGGMLSLLRELQIVPDDPTRIILDHHAYDSAENVIMGLIAAQLQFGGIPIRRIGISNSWLGKKKRFSLLAKELGIEDRLFFHGYAPWNRALDPDGAQRGEAHQCTLVENDPLMLQPDPWEKKRRMRYHGPTAFEHRFDQFAPHFPKFFAALNNLRDSGRTPDNVMALRQSFAQEILHEAVASKSQTISG